MTEIFYCAYYRALLRREDVERHNCQSDNGREDCNQLFKLGIRPAPWLYVPEGVRECQNDRTSNRS